ncbi:glycosyltransferase [Cohaesibacter intestini]|uniref:glycosyltransferase n=1 Tax=Cohaesibacter intestini TaxID=2211145 RepID=UPI000DE881CB|nr:glycosyltransferase [Cohaesibacter intestini]
MSENTPPSTLRFLALGNPKAAAFTSLSSALTVLGEIDFRHENEFASLVDVSNLVVEKNYKAILFPNPYGNETRLKIYRYCRALKISIIVFDRGGLPDSWYFDVGFNADSPSYDAENWDQPLSKEESDDVQAYRQQLVSSDKCLEDQGARIGVEALRAQMGLQGKKILFVPFQRPADTTVRYFKGEFGSFESFVDKIEQISASSELKNAGWVVVCKKHPLEEIRPKAGLSFAPDDTHIHDLLELCDAVCLINSGVGLLASLFDKPVYHFGEVYYGHEGLNRPVNEARDVIQALMSSLLKVSSETRDRLLNYLVNRIYSFGNFHTERVRQKDGSFRNITRRIDFTSLRFPDLQDCSDRKRVLCITPVIPHPVNRGSAQRTSQVLHAMRELGYFIDVAVLNRSERDTSSEDLAYRLTKEFPGCRFLIERHPSFTKEQSKMPFAIGAAIKKIQAIKSFIHKNPFSVTNNDECPPKFKEMVTSAAKYGSYDVVFFNYIKMTIDDVIKMELHAIADMHDIQTNRIRKDVAPHWPKLLRPLLINRYKASEKATLRKYDSLICISPVEQVEVKKEYAPNTPTHFLPVTFFRRTEVNVGSDYKYDLLFVGSNSDANADSVLWFLKNVWPRIITSRPDTTFFIQGAIGRNKNLILSRKSLVAADNIYSEIYVKDLEDTYKQARLVISPTTKGTGMKVKVIEALHYHKALIGTDVAFEGIEITSGVDAICANTAEGFTAQILFCLNNPDKRKELEAGAQSLFERKYSFEYAKKEIQRIITST